MVSSVTNMTGRPSRTQKDTDSSAVRSIRSSVQPSAKRRIGELPMKVHTSRAIPALWAIARRWLDVRHHGAGGAVRGDPELGVADLLTEPHHVRDCPGTRARQSDIGSVDPELVHHVKQLDLHIDRGIDRRGRLKAVSQRLVVKLDAPAPRRAIHIRSVPVVHQPLLVHCNSDRHCPRSGLAARGQTSHGRSGAASPLDRSVGLSPKRQRLAAKCPRRKNPVRNPSHFG